MEVKGVYKTISNLRRKKPPFIYTNKRKTSKKKNFVSTLAPVNKYPQFTSPFIHISLSISNCSTYTFPFSLTPKCFCFQLSLISPRFTGSMRDAVGVRDD